jgi:hypothetical protein
MIPANHKIYPFPYNLEDRVDYIKSQLKDKVKIKLDIRIKKSKSKDNLTQYELSFKNSKELKQYDDLFLEYKGKLVNSNWIFRIE